MRAWGQSVEEFSFILNLPISVCIIIMHLWSIVSDEEQFGNIILFWFCQHQPTAWFVCAELITVPEAYCNYSLDVCLQALGPCRVGLMPAMLGLVYVAVWIDPKPQSRAQRWPTSCCKHLRHHTAVRVPARVYIYVCKHVCNHSMYLWLDAKPQHKTGHPRWTELFWTWSRKLALLGCQLQTGWMNSLICRCHAVCFILCSCCPVKTLVLPVIMTKEKQLVD